MSKHRRRRRRDPKRPGKQSGPSADKARQLAELARRFGTTDSLGGGGSGAEDEDGLGDAVATARQQEYVRIWKNLHSDDGDDEADDTERDADEMEAESDEETQAEDDRMGQVMLEHPEYHAYFDDPNLLDAGGCTVEGVNPFAHVSMHTIVENQLASGDPPQVREYLERFEAAGLSRHEAVHQIARAVSDMIHELLQHDRVFEPARYLKSLEEIAAEVEGKRT